MTATVTVHVSHRTLNMDSSSGMSMSITPTSIPHTSPIPTVPAVTTTSPILSQLQLDTQHKNTVQQVVKTVDDVNPDDFFRNGVPVSAFQFPSSLDLESLFTTHSHIDPFTLIDTELKNVKHSILNMLGSDHPVIHAVASYFFEKTSGKQFRPAIMHLLARALQAGVVHSPIPKPAPFVTSCDCGCASSYPTSTSTSTSTSTPNFEINSDQQSMCDIIEVIHTASLLHDDVLDEATTRRGVASINQVFGNKLAILGGDFLLCRASLAVARIQKPQVMELAATIIESLVKGEILQMKPGMAPTLDGNLNIYLTKSYYKTASLIAGGCKGIAILGGYDTYVQQIAYEYGKHVGSAFQIVDDIIDFTSTSTQLGKPALNDMTNGIITAPLLYALHDYPQLQPLIDRKFKEEGDIQQALDYLARSDGLDRARVLAVQHCENAVAALLQLNPSPFQSALIHLVEKVLNREK